MLESWARSRYSLLGCSVEELVVVDGGGLVVAGGVVVVGGPEGGVVGQRALGVVEPDVVEGLDGVAGGVDQRLPAVEAGLPGQRLGLGVLGGEPELGDLVLAGDELVDVLGAGVLLDQELVAVVGLDVLLAAELGLGQAVLGLLAPGGALLDLALGQRRRGASRPPA